MEFDKIKIQYENDVVFGNELEKEMQAIYQKYNTKYFKDIFTDEGIVCRVGNCEVEILLEHSLFDPQRNLNVQITAHDVRDLEPGTKHLLYIASLNTRENLDLNDDSFEGIIGIGTYFDNDVTNITEALQSYPAVRVATEFLLYITYLYLYKYDGKIDKYLKEVLPLREYATYNYSFEKL